jgi:hypothetical protein
MSDPYSKLLTKMKMTIMTTTKNEDFDYVWHLSSKDKLVAVAVAVVGDDDDLY